MQHEWWPSISIQRRHKLAQSTDLGWKASTPSTVCLPKKRQMASDSGTVGGRGGCPSRDAEAAI
eukprot:10755814-Prorocentrum_lima.AAC.1